MVLSRFRTIYSRASGSPSPSPTLSRFHAHLSFSIVSAPLTRATGDSTLLRRLRRAIASSPTPPAAFHPVSVAAAPIGRNRSPNFPSPISLSPIFSCDVYVVAVVVVVVTATAAAVRPCRHHARAAAADAAATAATTPMPSPRALPLPKPPASRRHVCAAAALCALLPLVLGHGRRRSSLERTLT